MKLSDLEPLLLSEGCNKNTFAIGDRGSSSDAFCITNQNQRWKIFYTERGSDSAPIFSSDSESEACEFFLRQVLSQEHWHLIGWYMEEADAISLEERIRILGIKPVRNDVPRFVGENNAHYRVFVMGKDIFQVLRHIPEAPIINDTSYRMVTMQGVKLSLRYFETLRGLTSS